MNRREKQERRAKVPPKHPHSGRPKGSYSSEDSRQVRIASHTWRAAHKLAKLEGMSLAQWLTLELDKAILAKVGSSEAPLGLRLDRSLPGSE